MFSIVQPFNREGKSCEKCIKRPGCSEHGSCINTYGTSDTSDDMMEALACHCTDPSKWTGALCDKGEIDIISILRLTPNCIYTQFTRLLSFLYIILAICKAGCEHGSCNRPGECT